MPECRETDSLVLYESNIFGIQSGVDPLVCHEAPEARQQKFRDFAAGQQRLEHVEV